MTDSFQDVYAKYLQHADYGYPLRMPEPMSTLPQSYQDDGLQIGDVGIVDSKGQFDVLFNICKRSDNPLHDDYGVPKDFQPIQCGNVKSSTNAIPAGPIHSHGIRRIIRPNEPSPPTEYEFSSSTPAGAILILPCGAISAELLTTEQFREVAAENALDWFEFAKKRYGVRHLDRSLYLITGFHKARCWSLGSFKHPTDATGKILARMDRNSPNIYMLEFEFSGDRRHSHGVDDSGRINQTVFITGFKISVSGWLPDPVVLRVTESETVWSTLVRLLKTYLNQLRGFSDGHKPHTTISVEHRPQLTQPFHPSDIINRFLLSKNPNARVAITHDTQWMDTMKEGLTREDLLQEDRLETFLTRRYTISVGSQRENTTVFLQGRVDNTKDSVLPTVDLYDPSPELEMSDASAPDLEVSAPHTPELETSPSITPEHRSSSSPTPELEFLPSPIPSLDNPRIVITRMRAQDIHYGLRRIPVGFYVLFQFNGVQRRTRIKSIRLDDSGIEWEDKILLPSKATDIVRFTVYASFEVDPLLGNGEALYVSASSVEKLIGGTRLITFSSGKLGTTVPDPSLLITMGRWYSNHLAVTLNKDNSNLNSEESSALVQETNLGQEALLRYLDEYAREDLEHAVQHFECASRNCPPSHRCRAAVLVNLARAKFVSCQVDSTSVNLDEVISLYREALILRGSGHPDRPGTLLQLAQTLLFGYEKELCNGSAVVIVGPTTGAQAKGSSNADKIVELMVEIKRTCHEDSYERRAADLVLQTLKQHQVMVGAELVELDELVEELDRSIRIPPDWHFDRPYRMVNLGAALRRRFELTGYLGHLDKSISVTEEAVKLIPNGHFDKPWVLFCLGDTLCVRSVRGGAIGFDRSISMIKDALKSTSDSHVARPWMTARLGAVLLARFICGNASTLKMSIGMTGSVVHLTTQAPLNQLSNISGCRVISLPDLEEAISRHRDAAGQLDDNSKRSACLCNLATSLLVHFWCLGDPGDLMEAVSKHRDAITLSPNDHSDKPDFLNNLALSLRARFEYSGHLNDLEEAISTHKDAIKLISHDHHDKASHLDNLGNCFIARFDHLGRTSDIEEAISTIKAAVKLTPDVHPEKSSRLHNLALAFGTRFKHYGEMKDIEEATSNLTDAVKLMPNDHPDKPSYLNDLSLTLRAEFDHFRQLKEMGLLRAVKLP